MIGQARFALATSPIRTEPSAADLLPVKMVGYGGTAPPLLGSKPRVLLSYSYPLVLQAGMRGAIALFYTRSANRMAAGAAIAPALNLVRSEGDCLLPTGAKSGGWPG